jgi:hypothetical protein
MSARLWSFPGAPVASLATSGEKEPRLLPKPEWSGVVSVDESPENEELNERRLSGVYGLAGVAGDL